MDKRHALLIILTLILFCAGSVVGSADIDNLDPVEKERVHRLLFELQQTQTELSRFSGLLLDESLKLKQQVMMMDQRMSELQEILVSTEATPEPPAASEEKGGSALIDLTILVILVVILLAILIFLRNRRSFKENEEFSKEFEETWTASEEEDKTT